MKPHNINNKVNFMGGWYMEDTSICDDLINFYEDSPNKKAGLTANRIDKKIKDSTDIEIDNVDISTPIVNYLSILKETVNQYKEIYFYCNKNTSPWGIKETFNLQKYNPNQGFYGWHTERNSSANSLRHLVFMTYLNNVTDKGETEFYYQKLKIKPEKGLTLIWPTDWTFTHRGIVSSTQTKYIATGWYSFL